MKLPEILMDAEGYPTEEWLAYIRAIRPGTIPIMEFVSLICDNWHHGDYGFKLYRKRKDKQKLELSTLGWSGNEDTINAILCNVYLTHLAMTYSQWRVGGHHLFIINHNIK